MPGLGFSGQLPEIGKPTKEYEGFSDKVYIDKNGHPTVGYGHKLTQQEIAAKKFSNGINKDLALKLYQQDRQNIINKLYWKYPELKQHPEPVRKALEDMAYNMGEQFVDKFSNMKQALDRGDYVTAATEVLRGKGGGTESKYLHDVGQRALDNASRIALGYNATQKWKSKTQDIKDLFSKAQNQDSMQDTTGRTGSGYYTDKDDVIHMRIEKPVGLGFNR